VIDFQTDPTRYRHWKLSFDGPVATLTMDVDPAGGLMDGYELKLNSYDLGVDIELADAVQRLRFEHPEVKTVVLRSGKEGVFCAGANIRMLGKASHGHKVNFCKFTNETRLAIEDASENSGQIYLAAIAGSAAGGGYELAVTADHIMLIDDRRSSVSLPELPLLAVLPGTGGLTRLTDKRRVRRDRADIFCTAEEGVRGQRAVEWRLVDEVVPPSAWEAKIAERALELAERSDRDGAKGILLAPLERTIADDAVRYPHVLVALDRSARTATITIRGPEDLPADLRGIHDLGSGFWPLAMARQLDDALLHLRLNETSIGLLIFRSVGDPAEVLAADSLLEQYQTDWLVREIRLLLKRVLKRVDMMARSLIALIDPGSCFAGTLAELAFAADRSLMFAGTITTATATATTAGDNRGPATLHLSALNFSAFPMGNGLSRLANRFYGEPESLVAAAGLIGETLDADAAEAHGLVTFAYDDIDWNDEVRLILEERASFSPDALTGLEANLRFVGPETMETRIFGRLTAWQNWIFQRPNAVGEAGSLKRYGSGVRPDFNTERV
jgi:benzoyl-CoA-dihydrodiol lyase